MNNMLRRFVHAVDSHPFSMAVATVGTTTMTGMVLLKATDKNPFSGQRRPLSTQEAHFRAMVEEAKESTWRENIEIVAMAQEHSMMMSEGDQRRVSSFMKKIDDRGQQILHRDKEFWQQQKDSEEQEKLFATTTVW